MWFRKVKMLEGGRWKRKTIIHRDDGPAVIYDSGEERWYWHDWRVISFVEWDKLRKDYGEPVDESLIALWYLKYL